MKKFDDLKTREFYKKKYPVKWSKQITIELDKVFNKSFDSLTSFDSELLKVINYISDEVHKIIDDSHANKDFITVNMKVYEHDDDYRYGSISNIMSVFINEHWSEDEFVEAMRQQHEHDKEEQNKRRLEQVKIRQEQEYQEFLRLNKKYGTK